MVNGVDARLLKATKFPPEFNQKADMQKVNLQVMKKWIAGKILEILGREDDVVVELCFNLIEGPRYPDIKALQIQLTGFLDKDTASFCKELWKLMLSAQASPQGVPKELLEAKKAELIQEKIEADKAAEESRRRHEEAERREREVADMKDRDRRDRGIRARTGDTWRGGRRGDRGGDRVGDFSHPNRSRSPGYRDSGRGRGGYGEDRSARRDRYVPRVRGGDDRAWGHGRDRRRAARPPSVSPAGSRSRSISRGSDWSRAGRRRRLSSARPSRKRSLSRSRSPIKARRNARRDRNTSRTRSVSSRRRSPPPKRRKHSSRSRSSSESQSRTPVRRSRYARSSSSSRSPSPHARGRSRSRDRKSVHKGGRHRRRRSPSRSISRSNSSSDDARRDRRRESSHRLGTSSDSSANGRTGRRDRVSSKARRNTTSVSPQPKPSATSSPLDASQESRAAQNLPQNTAEKPEGTDEANSNYTTAAPSSKNQQNQQNQPNQPTQLAIKQPPLIASRIPKQVLQRKANALKEKLLREKIIKMRDARPAPAAAELSGEIPRYMKKTS